MFEDLTEPDIEEIKQRVEELEAEVSELELEIISNRRRMTKDLETISEAAKTINKCKEQFGEDKIEEILKEVEKEMRNSKPDVTVDDIEED